MTLKLIAQITGFAGLGIFSALLLSQPERHAGPFIALALAVTVALLLANVLAALRQAATIWRDLWSRMNYWHAMWVLLFLSMLIFRVRSTGQIEQSATDAWAFYRILLVSLVGTMLMVKFGIQRVSPSAMTRGMTGIYLGYCVLGLISTLWSVFPAWTLYKSTEYLVDVLLLAAAVSAVRRKEEFRTFFDLSYWLFLGLLLTVWAGAVFWPKLAFQPSRGLIHFQLFGVIPVVHTNSVGEYGAILAAISILRIYFGRGRNQRALYLFGFAISAAAMVLSQTRSAMAGFLVALILVFYAITPKFAVAATAAAALGLSLMAATAALILKFFERGQSEALLASASGRLDWWQAAWKIFEQHPWVGSGSQAAARFLVLARIDSSPSNLHNSFLEALIGTGIVGLFLLLLVFLGTWGRLLRELFALRHRGLLDPLLLEAIAILSVLSVRAIFSGVLVLHAPLFFLLVVGYAELLRRSRQAAWATSAGAQVRRTWRPSTRPAPTQAPQALA
jgi:O-antigen ligase